MVLPAVFRNILTKNNPVIGQKIEYTGEMDRQVLAQELMNRGVLTDRNGRSVKDLNTSELLHLRGR